MFLGNHPKCLQNVIFYNNFYTIIIYSGPSFIFLVNFLFFIKCAHRNLATHVLLTRAINRIKVKIKVKYLVLQLTIIIIIAVIDNFSLISFNIPRRSSSNSIAELGTSCCIQSWVNSRE